MTSYRLALLLAVGITSCAESSPPEILRESSEFVGGLVCVECHQNQVELWQNSHHDLAMQAANSNTVLGNFEGTPFTYAGVTSTFFTREDEFWVRTDGPDGALQDYRIAYTFGVYPLQQYLIDFPGGRYQALGIAWDARTTQQGGAALVSSLSG